MTVHELSRDQLTELKERMIDDEIYESVPDEKVFEKYEGVEFSNDDFYTTGK